MYNINKLKKYDISLPFRDIASVLLVIIKADSMLTKETTKYSRRKRI